METSPRPPSPLYVQVAETFETQIQNRTLQAGDKLPSIRELSQKLGISPGTAVAAYEWLERQGTIQIRPRSGHYVAIRRPNVPEPQTQVRRHPPTKVALADLMLEVQATARDPRVVPMGEAMISSELLPTARLNRSIRRVLSRFPEHAASYEEPAGSSELRRQIARLAFRLSFAFKPEDVIVTHGAIEAQNLAIRAVADPGDVVAVESPGCYEALRAIEALGMKAVEITTRPRLGPDLAEFKRATQEHSVKAFLTSACCQNPLGYVLPDSEKAAVVALAERMRVPIIEDDSFGDLGFSAGRSKPLKAFDSTGNVLYCSSYSHLVSPGFHLGWIHPGRYHAEIEALKAITTIATPSLIQLAFADFLESGAYERHLRKLVRVLSHSTRALGAEIAERFPRGTRIAHPDGGFFIWLQLPGNLSGFDLYRAALDRGIAVLPGTIFSPHRQFEDCIRISCGWSWSDRAESAVAEVGSLVNRRLLSE